MGGEGECGEGCERGGLSGSGVSEVMVNIKIGYLVISSFI